MDVMTLNPTTYLPETLVEGLTTKIWTERFQGDPGDFEFQTPKRKAISEILPEGTLVSLRDTDEIMIVESLEGPSDGSLIVKGRSPRFIIGDRTILGTYGKKFSMARSYTLLDAIEVMLWNALVNPTTIDLLRYAAMYRTLTDTVPNAVITETLPSSLTGSPARRWLEQGPLDETLEAYLANAGLGLRVKRPSDIPQVVINVTTSGTGKGTVTRKLSSVENKIQFDVYNGVDRTDRQSYRAPVVFRADAQHLKDTAYLLSSKAFKNVAEVRSKYGNRTIFRNVDESRKIGLGVRRLFVDAGEPDEGESVANFISDLPQFGQTALAENNRVVSFSAEESPASPYVFQRDYFLGDKVTLLSDDGINRTVTVTEFIRTQSADEEKSIPGFSPVPIEDGVSTDET